MATAIKERGILMHARSVLNILAGRKTQTRRIVKPQPLGFADTVQTVGWESGDTALRGVAGHYCLVKLRESRNEQHSRQGIPDDIEYHCPQGQPGDRLWVRETWRTFKSALSPDDNFGVEYRADGEKVYWPKWDAAFRDAVPNGGGWKPSLFMPRWASRITLEITDVRVERVRDISEADAYAEGIKIGDADFDDLGPNPIAAFSRLWDDTNGKGAWERNDWVWCISFQRIEETR
jgi:hypothetical protein